MTENYTLKIEYNKDIQKINKKYANTVRANGVIMTAPMVDENYWIFRVKVSDNQAIVGFPKFDTIGIGFQKEDDNWNTNLPYRMPAEQIYNWIKCNKGDKNISKRDCMAAIRMIQASAQLLLDT